MNTITNMLYDYHSSIDYIKSLVERGHIDDAMKELNKLQGEIMTDYITSLAQ